MADSIIFSNPDQKALEGAFPYSITSDGNVWRGSKQLVQQFMNGRWYAQIYREDGTKWSFDSTKMASSIFDPEPPPLTKESIFGDPYHASIIPDYPRYAVNSWGCVFCIAPPKRGPNAGSVYRVQESCVRDKYYVTLSDGGGGRKFILVDSLLEMARS